MNLILGRCAIMVLAVLTAACGDDCAYDSGLFGESTTPPPPELDGIWQGREAPFTKKDTYPWWQFDVEHDGGIDKVTGGDRIDGLLGCAFPIPAESTGRRFTSSTSVRATEPRWERRLRAKPLANPRLLRTRPPHPDGRHHSGQPRRRFPNGGPLERRDTGVPWLNGPGNRL